MRMSNESRTRTLIPLSVPTLWTWVALACCAVYVVQALLILPYPGLQNDEALFGAAIYQPRGEEFAFEVWGRRVPLMLMSYMGTFKSLLYLPLLEWFGTGIYTIRAPMVAVGALTVWLLFVTLRRIGGPAVAALGAALLATDPTFVLCTTFDWGPVAVQIAMTTGIVLLVDQYARTRQAWALAVAAFLTGLVVWNKAVALWWVTAFVVALVAVYGRRVIAYLPPRRVALGCAAVLLGALPLVAYNVRHPGATLRKNAHVSANQAATKIDVLYSTLNGSSLIDYIVNSPAPSRDLTAVQSLPVRAAGALGFPSRTLFPYALTASVLLLPLVWRSQLVGPFFVVLICCLVHYAQMLLVSGAGTGAHHVVLLYPWPHAMVALCAGALVSTLRTTIGFVGATLVVATQVFVYTTYLGLSIWTGSPIIWTDAIGPLRHSLVRLAPRQVVVMDWGLLASLRVLSEGQLPLLMGTDGVIGGSVARDTEARLGSWMDHEGWVFVSHVRDQEVFAGARQQLDEIATRRGLELQVIETIADSHGRSAFEVFRYVAPGARPVAFDEADPGIGTGIPKRGAFYYQPRAAHWWFWNTFDLTMFSKDIARFGEARLDTVTFDVQVGDFLDQAKPDEVRLRAPAVAKLLYGLREAENHGLRVMLILWYTNGLPDSLSGGAQVIGDESFRRYKELTRQLASVTKGHAVTFFFTNELFDLPAEYNVAAERWHLKEYPPANASFARWATGQSADLGRWNTQWGTSFSSWAEVDLKAVFPRREYWDWHASVIRARLPELVAAIKGENRLAKVGYEDYAFVYGWGDSAIPRPCPLDYIGFGIYRDMEISSVARAEEAYLKLTIAFPGVRVFVPEVGMDTDRHSEEEQALWLSEIAGWAKRRDVGINILMWRDFLPHPSLTTVAEARYGLYRSDGTAKPVVSALQDLVP